MTLHEDLAFRAKELLGDGEWRPIEEIYTELVKLVPPGMAKRRTEQERVSAWRLDNPGHPADEPVPPRKRPMTVEKQIASGARRIVMDFLNNGTFQIHPKRKMPRETLGEVQRVRMLYESKWIKGTEASLRSGLARVVKDNRRLLELLEDVRGKLDGQIPADLTERINRELTATAAVPSI